MFRKDVVYRSKFKDYRPLCRSIRQWLDHDARRGDADVPQIQAKNDVDLEPIPVDLADEVEGMYRLMDLISESGSNGCGMDPSSSLRDSNR